MARECGSTGPVQVRLATLLVSAIAVATAVATGALNGSDGKSGAILERSSMLFPRSAERDTTLLRAHQRSHALTDGSGILPETRHAAPQPVSFDRTAQVIAQVELVTNLMPSQRELIQQRVTEAGGGVVPLDDIVGPDAAAAVRALQEQAAYRIGLQKMRNSLIRKLELVGAGRSFEIEILETLDPEHCPRAQLNECTRALVNRLDETLSEEDSLWLRNYIEGLGDLDSSPSPLISDLRPATDEERKVSAERIALRLGLSEFQRQRYAELTAEVAQEVAERWEDEIAANPNDIARRRLSELFRAAQSRFEKQLQGLFTREQLARYYSLNSNSAFEQSGALQ